MPLHPVIAEWLERERSAPKKPRSAGTVEEARAALDGAAQVLGTGPAIDETLDILIPTRSGTLPGRLLRPAHDTRGLVVYLHGGGWVLGSIDSSETVARQLCRLGECAVLLVGYRLAPEHPFPAGLEDAEDAVRWANAHRQTLAGNTAPLVVAGDSAGANLATVVANTVATELPLSLQVLFYPVTDTSMAYPSYRLFASGPRLTHDDMQWFLSLYAPRHSWKDPRIAPIHASSLADAPPAWIATAEYDVLRDEGLAYAERLISAGVPVQYRMYEGLVHGFARMANQIDTAAQALEDAARAIKNALSHNTE